MITEDYVSFETAKLLKEKGFDETCRAFWKDWYHEKSLCDSNTSHCFEYCTNTMLEKYNDEDEINISAPTLQMAMKYLREEHNLHCDIGYDFISGWYNQITSLKEVVQDRYTEMKTYHPHKADNYSSYEDACESAIKYCLENLV